jgi:hypothetical protein
MAFTFKVELTLLAEPDPRRWHREDIPTRPRWTPELDIYQVRNALASWRHRVFRLLKFNCMALITHHMERSISESDALIEELTNIVTIETDRLDLAWLFSPVVTLTPDGVHLDIVLVEPR